MRIRFFDSRDGVDFGHDEIGECSIVGGVDKTENIRLAETGVGLFDTWHGLKRCKHFL